jgi:hypothetical protein
MVAALLLAACGGPATPLAATATVVPVAATETAVPSATWAAETATLPATATRAPSATEAAATATPARATATTGPSATATTHPAAAAVLAYLEARARADVAAVQALACPAFAGQAATEAVSFRSMNARLDGVVCAVAGASGEFTLVACTGKLVTTYGTETREWDQSAFIYRAAPAEGGQAWQMCGYE